MIILHDAKTLIITPNKCASTSLHMYFCNKPDTIWMNGPVGETWTMSQHTTMIPSNFSSYRKVLIVRNPWERLVSLWNHQRKYGWPIVDIRLNNFRAFVHEISYGHNKDHWFLKPQVWYLENIQTENGQGMVMPGDIIPAKLEELKIEDLPRLHVLGDNNWEFDYQTLGWAEAFCKDDAREFDYQPPKVSLPHRPSNVAKEQGGLFS